MNVRFTAWLTESERDALDRMARANGTSVNYLVRLAVRQFLGLPSPVSHLSHVTTDIAKVESK